MEWLKKLIEKHTKDGKLDNEALMKEVNTEFAKNAVPKETYNTLAETKKQLDKDIAERDTQLEALKKVDAAGLQTEITRLQGENKTAKEKYDADMKELTLTNAIKLAVAGKVHDEGLVAGLFDKAKLILNADGTITGLDDQLKTISESKKFLFLEEDPNGTGGSKGNGSKKKTPPDTDSIGKKLGEANNTQNTEMAKSQELYFK
jgi:hypothetical protein